MKIAIAQINLRVGDFEFNKALIESYIKKAKDRGADIVVFPELSVTGYPPEDLLHKKAFISDNRKYLDKLCGAVDGIAAIIGFVNEDKSGIHNSAAVIKNKKLLAVYDKTVLPNYGVFDEKRYFKPGKKPLVFSLGGIKAGINICEDIWHEGGPIREQARRGARVIFVLNASPYHMNKIREREEILTAKAKENRAHIVYANLVGGQDELIFDGYSMVVDPGGKIVARAEGFEEELLIADIDPGKANRPASKAKVAKLMPEDEEVYNALKLGLKDYLLKNDFKEAVIGISGGIDSALVAALAVDVLGKDKVHGVFMPTEYSSRESGEDAGRLAKNLGIHLESIPVQEIFELYLKTLSNYFKGTRSDITEENLQARIRGNIIMALSNKFGWLVLTTGNKSEMSTGYATLYGDMAGGLAVIKDVPKTLVYRLAKFRNSVDPVIPERILTKEPTAELKFDQKDSDTLPPYSTLDSILKLYIENDLEAEKIKQHGFRTDTVRKVLGLVDKSEYKRRQSPPGLKITPKAFGRDRRMPITNRYRPKS